MEETIGKRLRRLRSARGMTVVELADAVGVGESTIRQIERGGVTSPAFHLGLRLATALGVDPYDLAGMESWLQRRLTNIERRVSELEAHGSRSARGRRGRRGR